MVAQHLYDALFALPPEDEVEVLERLSRHLTAQNGPPGLSDGVRLLVDERLAEMQSDGFVGMTRDEAFRYVAERIAEQTESR